MQTITEWAKIVGVEPKFILALIALVLIIVVYDFNPTAGYILGLIAILAILTQK